MNIQEASRITQVSASTIRYYEKEHIIPPIPRNAQRVREFDESTLRRIKFVKTMRDAGMPIATLQEYIHLFDHVVHSEDQQLALLKQQKALMEKKQRQMQTAIDHLDYKITHFYSHVVPTQKQFRQP